jgi:Arc/MetJ-type ribon-helix-helix transcriptional regulator
MKSETQDKWITVKILRGVHSKIEKTVESSKGIYANVPDFIEQALREKLERLNK